MSIGLFIQEFLKRKGAYVFSSVVISKFLSLLLSVIILRILSKEDYGNLIYAYTVISFIMPFMGMGVFQSFIKHAPIQDFLYQRKQLFKYTFFGGIIASIILIGIVIGFTPLITQQLPNSYWYLISFSALILSLFIFESVKNYLRIFYLNKAFAKLEIIHSILVFTLGAGLTYWVGAIGFIIALVSVPLALSIYLLSKKRIISATNYKFTFTKKSYWFYGIYTSLGGLVSQLIFSVDIISIGNLLDNAKLIAQYKALSLIPFSLLFLPGAIIKTDFVKLVQEAKNRAFLVDYVKNFMLIFLFASIGLISIVYFLDEWLISLIFGESYLEQVNLFMIFSVGIVGAFIFRVPFGNIMVAIGWTKISTLISVLTLFADVILNYFWIQKWGIQGAAYATSLLLWLSGLTAFIVFLVYIYRLKEKE